MSVERWKERICSFIQDSVYQDTEITEDVLHGIAAVLCRVEEVIQFHQRQTFLTQAEQVYLDEHGRERDIPRQEGETSAQYSTRIGQIGNSVDCPDILAAVIPLVEIGEVLLVEDHAQPDLESTGFFQNRGGATEFNVNTGFSIIVDNQVHDPYSFMNREFFMNREDHMGRFLSSQELFDIIAEAINNVKACGTLYRLLERVDV